MFECQPSQSSYRHYMYVTQPRLCFTAKTLNKTCKMPRKHMTSDHLHTEYLGCKLGYMVVKGLNYTTTV